MAAILLCGLVLLTIHYGFINYGYARDEVRSRSLWIRENGKMQEFLRTLPQFPRRVYQFSDDDETSSTILQYLGKVSGCEIGKWYSLPRHVRWTHGRESRYRSQAEIEGLFAEAETGDIVLVPVNRANVWYNRMPMFRHASSLFPKLVPVSLQRRLRPIYQSYDQYRHRSIPLGIEASLVKQGRTDLLDGLRRTGMQLGFGWNIYRVE